jgi:multisubunit Na+/H+ antiporter MnhE subunit
LLWMAFASKTDKTEFHIGLVFALFGTVADAIVKAEGFGSFRPRAWWILLTFLTPWYILTGTWAVLKCLPASIRGTTGAFKAVKFDAGEQDAESAARRTMATALLTIPPNSVVVGIDGENGQMLIHEIEPEKPTFLAQELGVKE